MPGTGTGRQCRTAELAAFQGPSVWQRRQRRRPVLSPAASTGCSLTPHASIHPFRNLLLQAEEGDGSGQVIGSEQGR